MSDEATKKGRTPRFNIAYVRFPPEQYRRLQREHLLTGQSIPWLIRRYCSNAAELRPPAFDYETSRELLRQTGAIGNNLNQIAKRVNSGIADAVVEHVAAMHLLLEKIAAVAMRDYGDR